MPPALIDTHCHLDFPDFEKDLGTVIQRAKDSGISHIINIGSSLKGSRASLTLAKEYEFIYVGVGIHPNDADSYSDAVKAEIEVMLKQDKVVAIGEVGLDYYRNFSQKEKQKKAFLSLIQIAADSALPLIIHCRDSQQDTLEILKESAVKKAVVHCFSGDDNFLKICLDMGFYISFTCNITYKKSVNLRSLVKLVPLDRLFLETDAPFLPPQDMRGRRNEPAFIKFLAEEISRIKGLEIEKVCAMTSQNAKTFFNLQ